VKTKVKLSIFLFIGLVSLVYVFPFIFVEAAKLESGVTIKEAAPSETEKICDDGKDNDNDRKIDAGDQDCAAPATQCGLQILSGVPINYGQLNPAQESGDRRVLIKNLGVRPAEVWVQGGNWISDAAGNTIIPTIPGQEVTRVAIAPFVQAPYIPWGNKEALKTSDFPLGEISPQQILEVRFQVKVPVSGFSGSLHQEVTINLICLPNLSE